MTHRIFATDVFSANDLLNVPRREHSVPALSGTAWLFQTSPPEAHFLGYVAAATAVAEVIPRLRPWLLAAHTAVQARSAVVRHRRIWNSLAMRGLAVPSGDRTNEFEVPFDGGVRWFGGTSLTGAPDLKLAAAIIEAEPASVMVAIDHSAEEQLTTLLRGGWSHSQARPPGDVVEWLDSHAGLLLFPLGAFDDREAGVAALGRPDLISDLNRNSAR